MPQTSSPLSQDEKPINVIRLGRHDSVKRPLDKGANPEAKVRNWTALAVAVYEQDTAMVRLLIEKGANPNRLGPGQDNSPLWLAFIRQNLDVITTLLDLGADPDLENARGQRVDAACTGSCELELRTILASHRARKAIRAGIAAQLKPDAP